jgi:hypothetical protein
MDDVCPITATRYSVKDLDLAITKPWRPWYTPQSEVTIIDALIFMVLVLWLDCMLNWTMIKFRLEDTPSNTREGSHLLQCEELAIWFLASSLRDRLFFSTPSWKVFCHLPFQKWVSDHILIRFVMSGSKFSCSRGGETTYPTGHQ